jgi:glucose/arabinose dehydrogenase
MVQLFPRSIKRIALVLIFSLVFFLMGAFSSLQNTKGGRSWVLALRDRVLSATPNLPFGLKENLSHVLGVKEFHFPSVTQTLRYEMLLKRRLDLKIEGQLAQDQFGSIFAIDRNFGVFYRVQSVTDSNIVKISNLFREMTRLRNDKSKPIRVTDLHYSFDKFQVAVVFTDSSENHEWLELYSFQLASDLTLSNLSSIFRTSRIADRQNTAMWGGRISNSSSKIFVSVGEQRYDRSGFPKQSSQAIFEQNNLQSVFGCVIEIKPTDLTFQRFSCGHRNAQGLFYDNESKTIFESEHGPSGGDEVNILKRGLNYGWPMVSLGGAYGWPLADGPIPEFDVSSANTQYERRLAEFGFLRGIHVGFSPPVMSWVPSVGASQILRISEESNLNDWRGDLLVGTMTETALHRIRLMDQKVVLDERIPLGVRIRDMLISSGGDLVISTDEKEIVFLELRSKN